MNKFYVYIYYDPSNNIPFYVGKGSGNRAYTHLKEAYLKKNYGYHKNRYIRNLHNQGLNPVIKIVEENMYEDNAYEFESLLITTIGTIRHGNGPLTNYCNGTENIKFGPLKEKKSSGRCMKGELNPRYGKKLLPEQKEKFANTIQARSSEWKSKGTGKLKSIETKRKLSETRKGKLYCNGKKANIILDITEKIILHYNSKPFLNIQYGHVSKNGKIMTYKRAFSKEFSSLYNMSVNGIYNILDGKNKITIDLLFKNKNIKIKDHE